MMSVHCWELIAADSIPSEMAPLRLESATLQLGTPRDLGEHDPDRHYLLWPAEVSG